MTEFLHKDLSHKIIGLCIDIQKEYGSFHNERIYHKVLEEKLENGKINFESKPKLKIYSKGTGKFIGYYEPDFVVDDAIILELKAKPIFFKNDEIQLSEYIKVTKYEIGYLINFGIMPLYFKRIIFTNNRKNFIE